MAEIKSGFYSYKKIVDDGVEDYTVPFNFETDITLARKAQFSAFVSNFVVKDGNYLPMLKELAFNYGIVEYFTDVDTDNLMIGTLSDIENFLEGTNVVDIVKANMDTETLKSLMEDVDVNIQYKSGVKQNDIEKSICKLLVTLENKFNDLDVESLTSFAKVIGEMSGELNIDNLMQSYLKSDDYKNHTDELLEKKNNDIKRYKKIIGGMK